MTVPSYVFKSKAIRALKGNWQTALLVSFFASLPLTVVQLVQSTQLPDITMFASYGAMVAALQAIQPRTWFLLGAAVGAMFALTPVLAVSCNHYFVRRLQKEELGFSGLFSRMRIFGKSFLLYLLMSVQIFLWSLLLVVPGIIALLRYSMAPYYLAENPDLGVLEAMNLSKQAMKDQKMSYLLLELSFIGWLIAAMFSELLLSGVSVILALVASMFIQLYMATYLNAACASFFLAASAPDGMRAAQAEATALFKTFSGGFTGGRGPFGDGGSTGGTDAGTDGSDTDADEDRDTGGENGDDRPPSGPDDDNEG